MSDEAAAGLGRRIWRRVTNNKFLFISIIVHVVFALGATAFVVQSIVAKRKLTFTAAPPSPNPSQRALEHKVQMAKKQQTMSAPAQAKRITTTGLAKVALPEMPAMPSVNSMAAPTKMAGMGGTGVGVGASGGGMGLGGGGGGGGFSLPKIMADRCSPAARAAAMRQSGGKDSSEQAVVKALQFLKSKQNPDGSWGNEYSAAMTGLSLLCFLGHCEQRSPDYGPIVLKAVVRLVNEASQNNGRINMGKNNNSEKLLSYQHAIATYALAEAYTLTDKMPIHDTIEPALRAALKVLADGQLPSGAWAYGYWEKGKEAKPDMSVSGWNIQALKAVHYSPLHYGPAEAAFAKAINWVKTMQDMKTGIFGYNKADDGNDLAKHRLTGVGVLALESRPGNNAWIDKGIKAILEYPKVNYNDEHATLYSWYYETQACFIAGGKSWEQWNATYQDEIVKNQKPDGSWPRTRGKGTGEDLTEGGIYQTALCTLMLEVFYRYLPSSKATEDTGSSLMSFPSAQ